MIDPDTFDPDKPQEVLDAERNPDNAGNEVAIAAKRRNKAVIEKERAAAWDAMLSQRAGREALAIFLFDVCGLHKTVENAAHDTSSLHWKSGARDAGLNLQQELLRANRKQYMLLLDEHLTQERVTG